MKSIYSYLLAGLLAVSFFSCKNGDVSSSDKSEPVLKTQTDSVSYSIGLQMGKEFKKEGWDTLNTDLFARAVMKKIEGDTSHLLTKEQYQQVIQAHMEVLQKRRMEKNKKEGEAFLKKNKKKEGVKVTESGLQYKVLEKGSGKTPGPQDTVMVHFEGKFVDGEVFGSSYKRRKPAKLQVNRVIPGWSEGLQMMREGSKWKLFIPSDLAYGERGRRGIEPNSTLIFTVELLKIQ